MIVWDLVYSLLEPDFLNVHLSKLSYNFKLRRMSTLQDFQGAIFLCCLRLESHGWVCWACWYDLDPIQGQGHTAMTISPLQGPLLKLLLVLLTCLTSGITNILSIRQQQQLIYWTCHIIFGHFLANVRLRSLYAIARLSVCHLSVMLVRPTQAVQIFGNISTAFGTLAIRWHPVEISRRSSQGNPSVGGVKHKRGSQV